MSNNTSWLNQTVTRSSFVAPTHGFGMGDVCPQTGLAAAVGATTMHKRHTDAIQATWASAVQPWSPPVT
ncbi:MAG TPA: hypothetical protein VGE14_03620 [Marmoricola sp.]